MQLQHEIGYVALKQKKPCYFMQIARGNIKCASAYSLLLKMRMLAAS